MWERRVPGWPLRGARGARPAPARVVLLLTKILGCVSIIRPLAKRFVKFCNRGGSLPQFHVNHTETVVHRCFRIEPRSFQVVRFCTFEVAFQITRPAEIIMPFGMVRFALQRSLELCDSLIQFSAKKKKDRIIVMCTARLRA